MTHKHAYICYSLPFMCGFHCYHLWSPNSTCALLAMVCISSSGSWLPSLAIRSRRLTWRRISSSRGHQTHLRRCKIVTCDVETCYKGGNKGRGMVGLVGFQGSIFRFRLCFQKIGNLGFEAFNFCFLVEPLTSGRGKWWRKTAPV